MSLANTISRALPSSVSDALRPVWHRLGLYGRYFRDGGRLRFDRQLLTVEATRRLPGLDPFSIAVRSPREFRRWANFARNPKDKLYRWLIALGSDAVLWDIGSANGIEGCTALHANRCSVIFVEPFTPSIESILKSLALAEMRMGERPRIEVVQAACSDQPGYGRLITHTKPVAGETYNTVGAAADEYCQGGRGHMPERSVQWVKYVTLDEMHFESGMPLPTHIKMDVDGFERRVLAGGERVFASPQLRDCVIEVNDNNGAFVLEFMTRHGFEKYDELVHFDQPGVYTADYFFRRSSAE
jgi:FkbM family methyltransferase